MKRVVATLVASWLLFAPASVARKRHAKQNPVIRQAMERACGPAKQSFHIQTLQARSRAYPAPQDAAMLYFVALGAKSIWSGGPAVRVGLDGKWLGALYQGSYVMTRVPPGTHHLCAQGQGHLLPPSFVSLLQVDAKAGRSYYVLVNDAADFEYEPTTLMGMNEVNPDEGRLMVAEAEQSVSTPVLPEANP